MQYMQVQTDESPAEPVVAGAIYTCPMHPEIRQDHPGNCPNAWHDLGAGDAEP